MAWTLGRISMVATLVISLAGPAPVRAGDRLAKDEARAPILFARENVGALVLLGNSGVCRELALSPDQVHEAAFLRAMMVEKYFRATKSLPRLGAADRREAECRLRAEHERKAMVGIQAILDARQFLRFREIRLQCLSARQFTDDEDLHRLLEVSPEQALRFKTINGEHDAEVSKALPPGTELGEVLSRLEGLERQHARRVAGVLTHRQIARLEELRGKVFELVPDPRFRSLADNRS